MTIYIAFLRGINVGGNKKISMAELKSALLGIGLGRVQTYIQSGNVVFESEEEAGALRDRIEQEIKTSFGMSVTVILRTSEQFNRLIANCPYEGEELTGKQSIQLTLLTEPPSQKSIDLLAAGERGNDEYWINGEEVYFLFRQSILDSKPAVNLNKLGNLSTTRNWNTILKLADMAKALEA